MDGIAASCILIHITMTPLSGGKGEFTLYADGHATVSGMSVNDAARQFVEQLSSLKLPENLNMDCGKVATTIGIELWKRIN